MAAGGPGAGNPLSGQGAYTQFSGALWDKFDAISERALADVRAIRDVHRFFEKRAACSAKQSKALHSLASQKDMQHTASGSLETAWAGVLAHTMHEAELHSSVAMSLQEKVVDPLALMAKEMDAVRVRLVNEGQAAIKEYQKAVAALQAAQDKYNKCSREAVMARKALAMNKKDKDRDKLERDVAKLDTAARDADADYRRVVLETNAAQEQFFHHKLPKVHSEFEHSMFVRIHLLKMKLKQFVTTLELVPPQDVQGLATLLRSVDAVDQEADISAFVEENRTGDVHPPPFVYEAYDEVEGSGKKKFGGKLGKLGGMTRKKPGTPGVGGVASGAPPANSSGAPPSGQAPTGVVVGAGYGGGVGVAGGSSVGPAPAAASTVDQASVYQAFRPEEGKVFGRSMAELMELQSDVQTAIPVFLQRVVEAIYAMNGPSTEGIFRIPGIVEELNAAKAEIDRTGGDVDIVAISTDVSTPCGLLKAFLRELPEPLIPTEYYDTCVNEPDRGIEVLNALPELNRTVIVYLANFLQDLGSPDVVALTLMSLENLSMVFAPSLLRCPYTDPMKILQSAKLEGTFALRLLQLMPTRDELEDQYAAGEAGAAGAAGAEAAGAGAAAAGAGAAAAAGGGAGTAYAALPAQPGYAPAGQEQQQQHVAASHAQAADPSAEPEEETQYKAFSAFVEHPDATGADAGGADQYTKWGGAQG